ncbi:MAG: orotidine-5'-phosphate decarboxylase [Candidatus Omnitrophica bacterium]|nr:orotidine-5'-phosphate decarboxylase [Candidatus Omnitrophota bacterium]
MDSEKLIVALDMDDLDSAKAIVEKLYPTVKIFKIGSQLFTNNGPAAVEAVTAKGAKVFLDLKFHDIPNTVANAVKVATKLGVFMVNVHIQGGFNMMKQAVSAAREKARELKIEKPLVLGVTVLTSMGEKDLKDLEIRKGVKSQVTYLARLAKDAALDGVIASADEIQPIRWACGDDFVIVTPGIRPEWAQKNDQKRTATPKEAVKWGASYIVVGRPILDAPDPKAAAEKILGEINER